MKIRLLTLFLFTLSFSQRLQAQDAEFSQFYAAPMYLNPALAGSTFSPRFHINFRDQWPAFSHAYVSLAVSYDQFIEPINSGIGILVTGDRAGGGMYNTFGVSGIYSYQLGLSDNLAMKIGVQGGILQKRIDFQKLFFFDQINPITGFYDAANNLNPTAEAINTESVLVPDFSAGLVIFTSRLFAGGAVKHINQPDESFSASGSYRLPMRFTAHAGGSLWLDNNGDVTISPNAVYTQQAKFRQLNVGSYLKVQSVFGGIWYRHNIDHADAVILLAGIQKGIMKIGYSYDLSVSDLQSHSGGAHEISLIFNFDDREGAGTGRMKGRILQCPPMF